MTRKSIAQLQQELREQVKYANPFGNIGPDTTLTLIIYARQSSTRQFVENVYSAEQQRDGLLKYAKDTLHWQGPIKLLIENELAKRTSGTLPTDDRPGLIVVLEYVESGECSAVLSVDVSRLFRDESAIEAAVFAGTCKDHKVSVITLSDYYDFNNPTRKDTSRFIGKAMEAGNWITEHVKGKMLPGRLSKAEKGLVANGISPIGMQLVQVGDREKDVTLTASPHAPNVNALYKRFHELGADLTALHNEILGKPIFPDHPDIDPTTIRLTRVPGGWTIKNRSGLRHILTNPAYIGHLQFNGAIVKYNAWQPIVSQSLWDFADSHLSKYDVSGNEYERAPRKARYIKNTEDYGALLYGVRANGSPVIDGISGQHVYVQIGKQVKTGKRKAGYVIKDHSQMNTSFYVSSIDVRELDSIIERNLLESMIPESEYVRHMGRSVCDYTGKPLGSRSPSIEKAMSQVEGEQPVQPLTRLQRTIKEAEVALKRIIRRLATSEDVMTDVEVRQNYADKAKLTRQLDELTRKQKQEELTAESMQQAEEDILTAYEKWHKWPIDRKRRLIHILTESITLECIADGWLRLTINWSPILSTDEDTTTVSFAYMWRDSVRHWTTDEENTLRAMYASATRDELLHALPHRSWQSIKDKACGLKLPRQRYESHDLPDNMSISDNGIVVEFGLKHVDTGRRLWWFAESIPLDYQS